MINLEKIPLERLKIIQPGLLFLLEDNPEIIHSGTTRPSKEEMIEMPLTFCKVHIVQQIDKLLESDNESIKPGLLFLLKETNIFSYPTGYEYLKEPLEWLWQVKCGVWLEINIIKFNIWCLLQGLELPDIKTTIKIINSPSV